VGWVSSTRLPVRHLVAAALGATVVLAGCDSSSSPSATPTPSTPTSSASTSASPSPTPSATAPSQKKAATFLNYLYAHDIPRGVNATAQIKLGVTFVCASYKFHETTPQILQIAKQQGLHPRSKVKTLMTASVKYFCPQYAAASGLSTDG
jgi:hypothetical protein